MTGRLQISALGKYNHWHFCVCDGEWSWLKNWSSDIDKIKLIFKWIRQIFFQVLLEKTKVAIILCLEKGWHRTQEWVRREIWTVGGSVGRNPQNPKGLAVIFHLLSTYLFLGGGGFILQYVPGRVERTEVEQVAVCFHLLVPHDLPCKALLEDQDWSVFSSHYCITPPPPHPLQHYAHITHTNVVTGLRSTPFRSWYLNPRRCRWTRCCSEKAVIFML